MILSTWGARAVLTHTTSSLSRAAWARRTSHHDAVVARAVAVPARCKTLRRVSICISFCHCVGRGRPSRPSLALHSAQRQPLHHPTLEDEKHEHWGYSTEDC